MRDASICGLGQAAPNSMTSVTEIFPEDFAPTAAVGIVRMSDPIKFTIDGVEVEARRARRDHLASGAAPRHRDPPSLLRSRDRAIGADGNCRACMVEIEGERVLAASCLRQPTPGMKVGVATARAEASRKMVFELLLADQPAREIARMIRIPKFWRWADKVEASPPAASRRAGRPAADGSAIRRWRSISTPASTAICASGRAARSRSTTSSGWPIGGMARRSCSISTIRWVRARASDAASVSRRARPAR